VLFDWGEGVGVGEGGGGEVGEEASVVLEVGVWGKGRSRLVHRRNLFLEETCPYFRGRLGA
jgi:hypothetical protein